MPEVETGAGRETPLLYYWNVLRRRKLTVVGFAATLVAVVLVGSLAATRYYEAHAIVEIEPKAPTVLDLENVSEMVPRLYGNQLQVYYETQYRIIESRSVLEEAVRRLREEHGVNAFDDKTNPAGALRRMLSVEPEPETHLVRISVEYPNPELAALFANEVARAYMDINLDRSLDASRQALEWLGEQQEVYRDRQASSDERVHRFRMEHDLIGPSEDSNLTLETLQRVQEAWSDVHTRKLSVAANYREMERLMAQEDGWLALGNRLAQENTVLADMIGRLRELEQERVRLSARYRDEWPAVVQVDHEIEGLHEQIRQQVREAVAGQRAELELVQSEQEAIADDLQRLEQEMERLGEDLIQLRFLTAEAERNEHFFRNLDQRMTEVGLSQFMQANNLRIVDEARAPSDPVRPILLLNLATGLLVGLIGGSTLAILREYLDPTVRSREEAEAASGAPFLGVVPLARPELGEALASDDMEDSLLVHALPRSRIAECLRTVRANLLFRGGQARLRRLLVTSGMPREGKSFIAGNLAAIIAMTGSRVLLVDADLRRPMVHRRVGIENGRGFAEVLRGEADLTEVVRETRIPGLHVVTAGENRESPAELLASGAVGEALDAADGFDMVILDTPPVDVVADGLTLASLVDGTVFVIESGRTSRNIVGRCCQRLQEVNPALLGTVVNKLDLRSSGTEYTYYYREYDEYYGEQETAAHPA